MGGSIFGDLNNSSTVGLFAFHSANSDIVNFNLLLQPPKKGAVNL